METLIYLEKIKFGKAFDLRGINLIEKQNRDQAEHKRPCKKNKCNFLRLSTHSEPNQVIEDEEGESPVDKKGEYKD